MLPESRYIEDSFSVPKFTVEKEEVEDFLGELKSFQKQFSDCFNRSETRESFFKYTVGQLSVLERKSIEPIALAVKDANVRNLQYFVSDAIWDEEKMLIKHRLLVAEDMGDPRGVLIFDESGFVKKGNDSAGVAKQYCGSIGKVENSQVGVFAAYASPQGYALVNKKLFIPEKWFGQDYAERREKCLFPENLKFETKPSLAAKMLSEIITEGTLTFRYILADSLYSNGFVEEVEKLKDIYYFVGAASDTLCWLNPPTTIEKEYKRKGRTKKKEVLEKSSLKPISLKEVADKIEDCFWYRRKVSEGTKGEIEYEFARKRVTLSRNGMPTKVVWLIIKRGIKNKGEYAFYLSNAPVTTTLKTFVWLSGMRWAIEQCFEETKSELGMDQYEVRKYTGWNHHILTCMMAHFFLWHLKIRLGKKNSIYYSFSA